MTAAYSYVVLLYNILLLSRNRSVTLLQTDDWNNMVAILFITCYNYVVWMIVILNMNTGKLSDWQR